MCATTLVAGALAATGTAAPNAASNPLRASVFAIAGDPGAVEVVLTNTGRQTLRVPRWQLPGTMLSAELFQVTRDGRPVEYVGPMIKRGQPEASDFAILRPGQSVSTRVELASAYDIDAVGDYTVTFRAPLQYASTSDGRMLRLANGRAMEARSAPIRLFVDRDSADDIAGKAATTERKRPPSGGANVVNGVSYVGCSSTQISTAGSAVVEARKYAETSKGYLNTGTVGPRYTTWFGSYTSQRYGRATDNFEAIDAALDQTGAEITINCGCNQSYYAYVYPNRPYEIFVCRAFWNAPLTGTDSKAGTLVHEVSHFDVVANTDDVVYGQSGAKSLAISNPDDAIRNADSHEYFAENTPFQN